jgi:hypothetical protein
MTGRMRDMAIAYFKVVTQQSPAGTVKNHKKYLSDQPVIS